MASGLSPFSFNLRHLAAVAAVTHKGSVSAAASTLHLTQPAVTQAIARVESIMDVQLFERRTDGMTPLPPAMALAERVEQAAELIGSRRVTMAQLRAFLAVADNGSYAAAAAQSGLSQPTLHRAIGDLSLILRRSLVERRGRGIALTDAGRRTARNFRLARTELEAGLDEALGQSGGVPARITIGAMPLSRARVLPRALARFNTSFPAIEIVIVEGSHGELAESLRDGSIDMMVGAMRDPPPGPDLMQRPLFEDEVIIIARAGHPEAGPARDRPLSDLAGYAWILPSPGAPLRTRFDEMFRTAGLAPPPVPIECGSVMMIREILMQTDFLTLLSPDQVSVEQEAGWLVSLGAPPGGFSRAVALTTRAQWRPAPAQAAFIAELDRAATEPFASAYGTEREQICDSAR
ncbi:DNA-binding transcriptional LysR family regulator [Sphingobium sp. B2D3A]|uniref:LysR family transcriptional regulator n=1 Tax=unclassified Sphingobium TaxID=2611147 RepID=UPI002224CFAF|nr:MULTISPECIES: LysR family transcriptional regulator [unclassified Sphingobium]MCW2337974.1 DNA-binding transcriptional LysR family regulator [Sphingobium sp. B2D3A]MCW2384433.1 DNA-binding transcriptional LysR family regulator [Sphingobium sp. B2D3D]